MSTVQRKSKGKTEKYVGRLKGKNKKAVRKVIKKVPAQKNAKQGDPKVITVSNIMTPKQQARDARRQTEQTVTIDLKNQQHQIAITAPLDTSSLQGICLAYVSLALQRGYAAYSPKPQYPFWAYVYMLKVLRSYAGDQGQITNAMPYWMLCLCHALAPKKVPFQQGFATYSFQLDAPDYVPANDDWMPTVGYSSYGSVLLLQYPTSGTQVNGFPTASAGGLAYPGDGHGQNAFSNLILFMSENDTKTGKLRGSDIVNVVTETKFSEVVSCFAQVSSAQGSGYADVGGWVAQAQLEVPVMFPLMSVITTNSALGNAAPNRFYNSVATTSGDGLFLANYMATLATPKEYKNRRYPRFHAVDFLEFGDVLAQWCKALLQAYVDDPQFQTTKLLEPTSELPTQKQIDVGVIPIWPNAQLPNVQCPLTLQEVLLLLRNVIMCAFKETQAGVQALLPRYPSGGNPNEFTPYMAGANCCAIAAVDMQLPVALIENIRALVARKVIINEPHDVQWYIPVLGQFFNDVLSGNDYTFTIPGEGPPPNFDPAQVNVFASGSLFEQPSKDKMGRTIVTATSETSISLIDGNAGTTYAWINDPSRLKQLVGLWNGWLSTNNLGSFSMTLGTFGTELGISSLTSIAMTRHWVVATQQSIADQASFVDTRLKKNKAVRATVYSDRRVIADSSQSIMLAEPYEQVLSTWILPCNKSASGTTLAEQSNFVRWQALAGEPYSSSKSTGDDGILLSYQHQTFAERMTKTRNAGATDWETFFSSESNKGRGGILSGIGGALDSILGF